MKNNLIIIIKKIVKDSRSYNIVRSLLNIIYIPLHTIAGNNNFFLYKQIRFKLLCYRFWFYFSYYNIISFMVIYIIISYISFTVLAEEILIEKYDDTHLDCTCINNSKEILMSNGTRFIITQKSAFDNVFNEFNAPGYWAENEYVTDKEVVTMVHHVPLPLPNNIPDGNLSGEDAHYNLALATPPEFTTSEQQLKAFNEYVLTLPKMEQAAIILQNFATSISKINGNNPLVYQDLQEITRNFILSFKDNNQIWLAQNQFDLSAEGNHLVRYMTKLIKIAILENDISPSETIILKHCVSAIIIRCYENAHDMDAGQLLNQDGVYLEYYNRF